MPQIFGVPVCRHLFLLIHTWDDPPVPKDSLEQRRICGECVEDLLDRLERRALTATEVQQIMVLDARLEQWTQIQCEAWHDW